jgi:hypothetical protein
MAKKIIEPWGAKVVRFNHRHWVLPCLVHLDGYMSFVYATSRPGKPFPSSIAAAPALFAEPAGAVAAPDDAAVV